MKIHTDDEFTYHIFSKRLEVFTKGSTPETLVPVKVLLVDTHSKYSPHQGTHEKARRVAREVYATWMGEPPRHLGESPP